MPFRGYREAVRSPAVLALVLVAILGAVVAASLPGSASSRGWCSAAQKAQRAKAANAYAKQIPALRAAYFKTHKRAASRAAFVKHQRAQLAQLRNAAACIVPPTTTTPTSVPVATQVTYVFGSEMPAAAREEITGDVQFAVQDEATLVGQSIATVSAFASTSPDWLADEECRFSGHNDAGCLQSVHDRWVSGSSTAVGGNGAAFIYWASPGWGYGAGENQKIVAHELFHVLQYQLHKLVHNGETPPNQIRVSGPVWLDEGSAEFVGYRVAANRRLLTYQTTLASLVGRAKQVGTPLSSLQTLDEGTIANVYSLYEVAVDHLVGITPAGPPALATYFAAIGNGKAWPDAFAAAFGMSIDAYYANFAAYRSTL